MATTRAIRRYTDDPIPDADLAEILWYAQRAPSGTNRQKFRFITLRRDDPVAQPARQLLTESFRKGWVAKQADLDRDGAPERGLARGSGCRRRCSTTSTTSTPCRSIVLVGLERYRPPQLRRGGVGVPGVPEPPARRPRPRLRRGADRLARRRRGASCATVLGHPRRRRPARLRSRSACRPGATGRCAASRCARSSTTACGAARPTGSASGVTDDPYAVLGRRAPARPSEELRAARRRLASRRPPRPRRRHRRRRRPRCSG